MGRNLFEYHPDIGYRFIPNLRARVRHEGGGYLVQGNDIGFRCAHSVTARPPEGRKRVIVFGDSYTAGEGVSNAHRYSDVLERTLGDVEVLNFGLPGSGTDQQWLAFQNYARDLHYDVLLIAPMVENIRRNLQPQRLTQSAFEDRRVWRAKPYFTLEGETLVRHHQPVPKAVIGDETEDDGADEGGGLRGIVRAVTERVDERVPGFRAWTQRRRGLALPEEYNEADHPGWRLMRAILERWIGEVDAPVVLFPIPTFDHISGSIRSEPYQTRFAEVAGSTGCHLVDPLPQLLALDADARQGLRFRDDEHPTPRCHELLAEMLAPHVRAALEREVPA